MLSAAVTNLGKYIEGSLVFEFVDLPVSEGEWEAALAKIGIGEVDEYGNEYEEWFITDWDDDSGVVGKLLGEYPTLEKMNEAGELIEAIDDCNGDLNALIGVCEGYDIDPDTHGLNDYIDDEQIAEMVQEKLENGDWRSVYHFLRAAGGSLCADLYKLDGYENVVPVENTEKEFQDKAEQIIFDILNPNH